MKRRHKRWSDVIRWRYPGTPLPQITIREKNEMARASTQANAGTIWELLTSKGGAKLDDGIPWTLSRGYPSPLGGRGHTRVAVTVIHYPNLIRTRERRHCLDE